MKLFLTWTILTWTLAFLLSTSIAASAETRYEVRVDKNDPDAFHTIAAAISAAPAHPLRPYQIQVAPGDYYEKLVIDKPNIQLLGSGESNTRLFHDTYAGLRKPGSDLEWGTSGSATLIIRAPSFVARDIHIENSFDYPANDRLPNSDPRKLRGSQAVAVMTDTGSDKALFDRVTLSGYQDTLFTLSGRSLFRHSTIKGHVDFIFGAGTAVFLDSDIVTRPRQNSMSTIGYITAPSTRIENPFGLVFINSRLLRESGVEDNSMGLGRPWHPTTTFADGRYADPNAIGQAVFINCWMDAHIQREPWHSMGGTAPDGSRMEFQPQDSRFFEFASRGPGALENPARRQLSIEQAELFTLENMLGDWQPPPAGDSRTLTRRLENELPDYSIQREYKHQIKQFPFISPIADKTPADVKAERNLVYKTVGERGLHLDVFSPAKSGQAAPAVLLVHGGGWRSGDRSHQVPMAQALAQAGYIGVPVEYRLSREALYPAGFHDVQAAIRWLRTNSARFNIDPERIAVLGASAGAQIATLIGSTGHIPVFAGASTVVDGVDSRVQAVINVDGVVDLESPAAREFEDKPGKVSYMALWLGGRYRDRPDLWREASPLQFAGKYTPPTLFINSAQPRFHVGRDEYVSVLKHHGTYAEIHTLPDSPHSFWLFHPWFDNTRNLLIAFLNRVFRNKPEVSQYPSDVFNEVRIATLPEDQQDLWRDYLAKSQRIAKNDAAQLSAELALHKLTTAVPAPKLGDQARNQYRQEWAQNRSEWIDDRLITNILSWQTPSGGWSKGTDIYAAPRQQGQHYGVETHYVPTFDNSATFEQIQILSAAYKKSPDERIGAGLRRAIDLVLNAQFPSGGWPQTYPLAHSYHDWTTYNDSVISNVINLYEDILTRPQEYAVNDTLLRRVRASRDRALKNIIADQVQVAPDQAGWGQQHDPFTHALRPARAFEMPALATAESSDLLLALMRIERPSLQLHTAIEHGIEWLRQTRLENLRWQRYPDKTSELIVEPGAPGLWPRMIDAQSGEALFGDREGSVHRDVSEISLERQLGYAWFTTSPAAALTGFQDWVKQY